MLICTLNLENFGGIERESIEAYSCLLKKFENVKLLSPKRYYKGLFKNFIARLIFIIRIYLALFSHRNIIIMHAKLVKPIYLLSKFSSTTRRGFKIRSYYRLERIYFS